VADNRKRKYSDPSAPLWCLSYGDMVTNMLCFFVMLLMFAKFDASSDAASSANRAAEDAFAPAFSLTAAKGSHQWLTEGGKGILLMPMKRDMSEIPRIAAKVKKLLNTVSMRDKLLVLSDEQKVKIRIPSKVLFLSGSAILKPGFEDVLTALLPVISEIPNNIRIVGHSDDVPTKSPMFPSNWELSSARACSVVRYYIDHLQQDPTRFSAEGFAEFQPQVENLTESGRETNRRVEINILTSKQKKPVPTNWE